MPKNPPHPKSMFPVKKSIDLEAPKGDQNTFQKGKVQCGRSNAPSVRAGETGPLADQGDPKGISDGFRLTHWKRVARSSQPESTRKDVTNVLPKKRRHSDSAGDHRLVSLPHKERKSKSD
jgi:hypothetical protein